MEEALDSAIAKLPDQSGALLITTQESNEGIMTRYRSNISRESALIVIKSLISKWEESETKGEGY